MQNKAKQLTNQSTIIASMSAFFGEPYYSNIPFGYVSPYQYERQRILEESRRRRAEMQYRRQLEERERRRQAAVLDYHRKIAREQALREQHHLRQLNDEDEESDQNYIVRGHDGDLYRVPARHIISKKHQKQAADEESDLYNIIRGPDGGLYRVPASHVVNKKYEKQDAHEPTTENEVHEPKHRNQSLAHLPSVEETHYVTKVKGDPISKANEGSTSQRMTCDSSSEESSVDESQNDAPITADVIVEDASDDEEVKELKSVWRNRRPSPGTLMEPVEAL